MIIVSQRKRRDSDVSSTRFFRIVVFLTLIQGSLLLQAAGDSQDPGSIISMESFQFLIHGRQSFEIPGSIEARNLKTPLDSQDWIRASPTGRSGNAVEFGSRIVLKPADGVDLDAIISDRPLRKYRSPAVGWYILQAKNARTACREAHEIGQLGLADICYPVMRRKLRRSGSFEPYPDDPLFKNQWHLENRSPAGSRLGIDLNIRSAWPLSKGEHVTIAVVDDGIELDHPELVTATRFQPHFNFVLNIAQGTPLIGSHDHGTVVAGLIAADLNNQLGISGVAPKSRLTSLGIWRRDDNLVSDERMMDMFQYRLDIIDIQNHSWGTIQPFLGLPTPLEQIGIRTAIKDGRNGLGVIMVRAAGNYRQPENSGGTSNDFPGDGDVNDDAYASDPRVITVSAVRSDGQIAGYSSRGACILVAAPSGGLEQKYRGLLTTDRAGVLGWNRGAEGDPEGDYTFHPNSFSGTSAATPLISGLAALLLSVNPSLSYRDVQQILALSSRQVDPGDVDVIVNGAGFRVSHNAGFGLPRASVAVQFAQQWNPRPVLIKKTYLNAQRKVIPDDGLRLNITGGRIPDSLTSIQVIPGQGPHADESTAVLPLVSVGKALEPLTDDLQGKAALVQRGENFFYQKIQHAADAGAELAVIYNNLDGGERFVMQDTDYTPIPAVMISQNDGEALEELLEDPINAPTIRGQLVLTSTFYTFDVSDTMICEHVGIQLKADHKARGHLRITLVSPQGTRSVLQHLNGDENSFPSGEGWTYFSTQHFFESSAGRWTLTVSDESPGQVGSVEECSLILHGVTIIDTDADGLDDNWERSHFNGLSSIAPGDPDEDGFNNMVEQIMLTDPSNSDGIIELNLSRWNDEHIRLSWPSNEGRHYEILAGEHVGEPMEVIATVPGRFPESEWISRSSVGLNEFFRVRELSEE